MRRLIATFSMVSAVSVLGAVGARAEVSIPRQSPTAKVVQQIGLTEVTVEYDCPAAGGRKIWGGVVPYDKPWTIGNNPTPKITFSQDVVIGDKTVSAGTYWLLATPSKTSSRY